MVQKWLKMVSQKVGPNAKIKNTKIAENSSKWSKLVKNGDMFKGWSNVQFFKMETEKCKLLKKTRNVQKAKNA